MEVKASERAGILSSTFRRIRITRRVKWLFAGLIAVSFVSVVPLTSMYYGMELLRSGGATTLSGWVTTVSRDKLLFATNYFNSLWVTPERLVIDVSFENFQKLALKRQQAMANGFLLAEDDDWVPGRIRHGNKTYQVDLKLKGELGDHWWHDREWSFKVNVKRNETIFGMKRFALQAPRTRKFLNEWVFHRLLENAGLINLRYDFASVVLNGKQLPIYAVEENFDKRLIERTKRREGPIFRFHAGMYRANPAGLAEPFLGSAIEPYQPNRITRTPSLMAQFDQAKNLIEGFRRGTLRTSDVFDVEQLSMLFAITDLVGQRHASTPKNLRFYYNPVTSKIEPVGYDNTNIFALEEKGVTGAGRKVTRDGRNRYRGWFEAYFEDHEFFKEYIGALHTVSRASYLDDFFARLGNEYQEKSAILHKSYPWYRFDRELLYRNQAYIRKLLDPDKAFHAYLDSFDSSTNVVTLSLVSIYGLPIEILDLTVADEFEIRLPSDVLLQGYNRAHPSEPTTIVFQLPETFSWRDEHRDQLVVGYRVLGLPGRATETVRPWTLNNEPLEFAKRVRTKADLNAVPFVHVDETNRTLAIQPGTWVIDQDLILPRNYTVTAVSGTTLDLVNGALILSHSPLSFIGTRTQPISIMSSDQSGEGLFVVKAGGTSRLEHVLFANLTCADSLTGAVTFYESPVEVDHGLFTNVQAEDALNVIRSRFSITNTTFSHTFSDALDADFSDGDISTSGFSSLGNDAIDISGSIVRLSDIRIDRSGDKGLSIGENSTLLGKDIQIRDAKVGVASKDHSDGQITRVQIRNSKVGFAVYRKKSEFGAATLTVTHANMEEVQQLHLVEEGSRLVLNGEPIRGAQTKVNEFLNNLVMASGDARPSL